MTGNELLKRHLQQQVGRAIDFQRRIDPLSDAVAPDEGLDLCNTILTMVNAFNKCIASAKDAAWQPSSRSAFELKMQIGCGTESHHTHLGWQRSRVELQVLRRHAAHVGARHGRASGTYGSIWRCVPVAIPECCGTARRPSKLRHTARGAKACAFPQSPTHIVVRHANDRIRDSTGHGFKLPKHVAHMALVMATPGAYRSTQRP